MLLYVRAQLAQHRGDLRELRKLYRQSKTPSDRSGILALIACELGYRKNPIALELIEKARRLAVDDYRRLVFINSQEWFIRQLLAGDPVVTQAMNEVKTEFLNNNR